MRGTQASWSVRLLILALLVGGVLRFYHLGTNVNGLHPDEALYGYEGYAIQTTGCDYRLTGCPPLYLKGYSTVWDNRTSVLYPYLYAGLWQLLPMNDFNLRLPSAMFGLAVIVLTFWLVRLLWPDRRIVAGLAAFLVAVSPVGVNWSRVGHDPITLPLFVGLVVASVLRAKQQPRWLLLAGVVLALGFYSYQPFKFVGPAMFLLTLWYTRPSWSASFRRWLVLSAIVGALMSVPFFVNQLMHWSTVQKEFSSLAIWNNSYSWLRLPYNLVMYIATDFVNPGLTILVVPLFAVVGWLYLRSQNRRLALFLAGWIGVAIVPILITIWKWGGNDMASRSLATLGPLEFLAALGCWPAWLYVRKQFTSVTWRRWGAGLAVGLLVSTTLGLSGLVNMVDGGFCCYLYGGLNQALAVVERPEYQHRPVVIDYLYHDQIVNILWQTKVPPREVQTAAAEWSVSRPGTKDHSEFPTQFGRYTVCPVERCYDSTSNALYIVPATALSERQTIFTFPLHFFRWILPWKVVDNVQSR